GRDIRHLSHPCVLQNGGTSQHHHHHHIIIIIIHRPALNKTKENPHLDDFGDFMGLECPNIFSHSVGPHWTLSVSGRHCSCSDIRSRGNILKNSPASMGIEDI